MTYDPFVLDRLPPSELLPEFLFDLPELKYPERLNAARELIAGGSADAISILNASGSWTYAELDDFSGRIAALLIDDAGLIPGNRVLLRGPNSYTMIASWLGILKAGGVVVATMPLLRPGEIATVIERAQISHAIVDSRYIGDFRQAVDQTHFVRHIVTYDGDFGRGELEQRTALLQPRPPHDTGRDEPALIAFTSGTTGIPKACVHFHRDILAPCDTFARFLVEPQPGNIFMTSAPMAFTFGLGITPLFALRFGASSATIEQASPAALLESVAKFGVTHLGTAPTAYKAMLAAPGLEAALRSLRYCISAGEHLPEASWRAWKERTGISITDGIGATEMMHIFVSAAGNDVRPGSTGKAVPGYTATILDQSGNSIAEGTGRLAIKGPTGCRYLDDPRQRDYVVNGWNITGDTYRRDRDGYFWYVARSDDMIVSSGYNISAPEVENALLMHPAVAECAVVGIPCPDRGQLVKAFVVLAGDCAPSDELVTLLQAAVKSHIAPYKYPRQIEFVPSLPKTQTGKLRRSELRSQH